MTLIFAAERENEVVLMADTLVSYSLKSRASAIRPISQINKFAAAGEEGLAAQVQKIIYLHPTLAVACAGDPDVAQAIVRHLVKSAEFPISQGNLLSLLDAHPSIEKVRLIFFGIEKLEGDRAHTLTLGSRGTSYIRVNGRDRYHFAGTGKDHFHVDLAAVEMTVVDDNIPAGERQVYSLMLDYFGKFVLSFATEIIAGAPFEHSYGGGFEMLFLNGGGLLTKVPYKILLWVIRDGRATLRGPLFNFDYVPGGTLMAERIPFLVEEIDDYAAVPIKGLVPELQGLNSTVGAPPVEAHLFITEGSSLLSSICLVNKPEIFLTTVNPETRFPDFQISEAFLQMLDPLGVKAIELVNMEPR